MRHDGRPSGVVITKEGRFFQPVMVKLEADLADRRVQAKLRIAEVHWGRRKMTLPLKVITKESVSTVFVRNWGLIRSTLRPRFFKHFPERIVSRVDRCLRRWPSLAARRWAITLRSPSDLTSSYTAIRAG